MKEYFGTSQGSSFQKHMKCLSQSIESHHPLPKPTKNLIQKTPRKSLAFCNKTLERLKFGKTSVGKSRGTITERSYFGKWSQKFKGFEQNLRNIERWLDQKEVFLTGAGDESEWKKVEVITDWCMQLWSLLSDVLNVDLKVFERCISTFQTLFEGLERNHEAKIHRYEVKISILDKANFQLQSDIFKIKKKLESKEEEGGSLKNLI
jgi:hypothetical protein